jgi:tellurite resistance protein
VRSVHIEAMLDQAAKHVAEQGRDARLRDVIAHLHEDGARAEVAFVLAAAIAFADNAIADEENEMLNAFAEGLGINESRADELLDSVEADLTERPA